MPLDSITPVAFALHNRPGAHAALLGSGLSSAAGIPTGWEILVRLVEQAAAVHGQDADGALEWYRTEVGDEPTYSGVVAKLGLTPAERHALVRRFLYGEDGTLPPPTLAHRALAELVAGDWIRVVLTTNFDPLTEVALRDAGVDVSVLSSADAVAGSVPLVHAGPTLVKLHGDYLDPRIKNTEVELDLYDEPVSRLLEQVLDEYGLIVCGWSADHDTALRSAFERCASRRFSTFWVARGGRLSEAAAAVVRQRDAVVVQVAGADEFFTRLLAACMSLRELDRSDPLSVAVQVASLKRDLRTPESAVRAHDVVRRELQRVLELTADSPANDAGQHPARLRGLLTSLDMAVAVVATLAYWGSAETDRWWTDEIARQLRRREDGGTVVMLDLPRVPSVVLLYAAGTAAIAAHRDDLLERLLSLPEIRDPYTGQFVSASLTAQPQLLGTADPIADIYRVLRPVFVDHLALGLEEFADCFERWQYLRYVHSVSVVLPDGAHRNEPATHVRVDGFQRSEPVPHRWLVRELHRLGSDHPLVRAGCSEDIATIPEIAEHLLSTWHERAEKADWKLVPNGGGVLPSGRHYPGSYTDDPDVRFGWLTSSTASD
jgi:hypothetical protein